MLRQAGQGTVGAASALLAQNAMLRGAFQHQGRLAVRTSPGDKSLTYRSMLRSAVVVAGRLERAGVGGAPSTERVNGQDVPVGPRVGVLARGDAYAAAQWGVWLRGGVAVPLCPDHPIGEVGHVLRSCDPCSAIVADTTDGWPGSVLLGLLDEGPRVASPVVISALETGDGSPGSRDVTVAELDAAMAGVPPAEGATAAMMLFTSGTTSRPKGVVHTHATLSAMTATLRAAWGWSASDRVLNCLPMHHLHGVVNVAACAQASGASVLWQDRFDAGAVLRSLTAGGPDAPTLFMGVPTMYARMLSALEAMPARERAEAASSMRASLRLMVSGSAPLPAALSERWTRATGGITLLERYGMTELGMALSNGVTADRQAPGMVGSPLPGVQCAIVPTPGQEADDGQGELWVRGACVSPGYWRRDEANDESYVPAGSRLAAGLGFTIPPRDLHAGADASGVPPPPPGGPWFRTGDIARVREADGMWQLLGRASTDILKSAGYKVSALEVEAAVAEDDAVEEVAVVGVPDASGDLGEVITALLAVRDGAEAPTPESLARSVGHRIARYKLPRRVVVVPRIQRNAMGKVNKKALLAWLQERPGSS